MKLKKIIFKVLPLHLFIKLRSGYRSFLKSVYRPLSEDEFSKILTDQLGIGKGSVVFIHSSIDNLNIRFDVIKLLDILISTVGENGTLLFPAWHFNYRAEDYLRKKLVFDVRRSPSVMGLLSEAARRHPDSIRSIHPINSIVALGKNAAELTEMHGTSIYPCDETSPYYKLMKYEGKIIGIGVDTNFLSFVHCPEDILKEKFPVKTRLDEVFDATVKTPDGQFQVVRTLASHPQIKNNDITAFVHQYIDPSICRNLNFRGNRFFTARSVALFDEMIRLAKENKTIYSDKASFRNFPEHKT
ncbi:MAG: AAC(3) family N-acetyltransferase [Bacteroidales bacterium]|nr:AAC(3) family N-acetyltransferase [Bacteroidales bacterium]